MRCHKNAQWINDVEVAGFPSTFHRSDVYECPICEKRVITGISVDGQLFDPGKEPADSITYAHHPKQLEEFAEQFADL